ncbi:MAG TPA: hypothetical protein VNB06_16360 [Thermoanaerobaculia bacterium]|nr:hypothetical protein [Thermoanaerobaculia bacterium]
MPCSHLPRDMPRGRGRASSEERVTPASDPRAYGHLNLTRNPFGEAAAADRVATAVTELGDLPERLARPGFALQILGDSGRGKTTHLLALRQFFPEAPWVRVDPGASPRMPAGTPLFVDEAQHLSPWRRRRLYRHRVRSLALGTHVDLQAELERAGYQVHTIRPAAEVSVERLEAIFNARIAWAMRAPGPVPVVPRRTIEALIAHAHDDVRAMEGLLYDALQRAQEIGDVEV